MNKIVNIALQILPSSSTVHPYKLVDKAIEVIAASGLKYRVTPFETVIEGTYDQVMEIVKQAQQACYDAGAESMMTYIKIQSSKDTDVSIEDKMEKYE
ncbi:MAG: thiamine-binding protein [Bacteroidales bacterium]|nr:thiamine-binding protein [Bacteroidales bacterium]